VKSDAGNAPPAISLEVFQLRWVILIVLVSGCAPDKVAHFSIGAVASAAMTEWTGDPLKGCAAAFGLGIAKEVYDSRTHNFDPLDALATTAGCSLSWNF